MKTRLLSLFVIIMIYCAAFVGCNANVIDASGAQLSSSSNPTSSGNDITVVEMQEFKDIKAKAERGDVEAQCWLAICYDNGLYGCKIDKLQAQELYQKVANHVNENLATVQYCKGICFYFGYGVRAAIILTIMPFRLP